MSIDLFIARVERLLPQLSSLKIGTRIAAGFAAVLALAIAIAVVGVLGLSSAGGRIANYAKEADDTRRLGDVTSDISALRLNMVRYAVQGDAKALTQAKELRDRLGEQLAEATGREQGEHLARLERMTKLLNEYAAVMERVQTLRTQRDTLIRDTLNPSAEQVRENLEVVVRTSMTKDGFEAGAHASATLATFFQARLAANQFLVSPSTEVARQTKRLVEDFVSDADNLMTYLRDPALRRQASDSVNLAMDYGGAFDQVAASALETNDLVFGKMNTLGDEFAAVADTLKAAQTEAMQTIEQETRSGTAAGTRLAELFAVAALLIGGVLALLTARAIVGPVKAMTKCMTRLADGDLAADIPATGRHDEIGDMGRAVQVFKDNAIAVEKLRAEQAATDARIAAERHAAMQTLADDFQAHVSAVVDHVGSAATEMEATSRSMAAISERTTGQATAAAAAAEEASANVQTVASAAEELTSSIAEISRQVVHASATAAGAAKKAEHTDAIVRSMAEAAQRIDEVVRMITDIAGQTNLLALNATIEAARAGEAGKGFAVVANEVKSLANQTAKATEEIGQQIHAIQSVTRDAVAAIQDISLTVNEINEISAAVAAAVEEQQAATREIARNVEQAATGTAEVARNVAGVTEAANEAGRAASQVLTESQSLSKTSAELGSEADSFIARVRQA